ncbi:MAG: nucleotidyltransferase domain-containing protein [Thermomicrobiales bacterium]
MADRAGRGRGSERRRENALLLAASRCPDAPPQATPENAEYDWRYLLAAAEQQGVSALLRQSLTGVGAVVPPDWARAALDAAYWGQHFRNRLLLDELATLLARAASAGVPVIPLKGAALVHRYYPAAALRPMSDIDLLIRPDDTERMAGLLTACGYLLVTRQTASDGAPEREYAFVAHRAEGAALVEYRSEPLDPMTGFPGGLDSVLTARLRVHAARMWERGETGEYAGAPVMQIAPEDLLLHVTSHLATRHAGFRLLWLHDVCRILVAHSTDFDWRYFWEEAALLNLTVPVEAALTAAHRWLDAPLPPSGGGLQPATARFGRLNPPRGHPRHQ